MIKFKGLSDWNFLSKIIKTTNYDLGRFLRTECPIFGQNLMN